MHASDTAVVSHRGVRRYATTYAEMAEMAGRFSAELIRRGIVPGERVVLWGDNSAAWIAAFFGCMLRGVLAVPLDAAGSDDFAQRVAADVTPKLIVGDADRLKALATDIPTLTFAGFEQSLPAQPDFSVDASVSEDTAFQIVFTSGTTSEPKGIVHTHRNVLASLRPIEAEIEKYRRYERLVHPLRFLHTLPLSHVFGQFMGLWIPAVIGAELHFTDVIEPARMVHLTRRERISVLIAVPRMLTLLRSHLLGQFPALKAELEAADSLSIAKRWWRFRAIHRAFGWKFWALISGGASLPAELELFWNRLGFALIQGYGMTETTALVTLNHPFRIGRGTIGKALPGREVRLSESGELLVRGDMVAASTWQNGKLQKRSEEWLATGDVAEQSETGDFRFLGRKGDAIVASSGLNIFPEDLEAAMLKQPGVRACAVEGCEFEAGAEPVCVVIFIGDDPALQQAVSRANQSLAEFQQIRRVLRWPELAFPYTSTGKLLKRNVRDWACRELSRAKGEALPTGDGLRAIISSITGEEGPAGGDELRLSEDLHLDSLGRVQLASLIEQKTGVPLGDDEAAALKTLGDFRQRISSPAPPVEACTPDGSWQYAQASAPPTVHRDLAPQATPQASPHIYPRWPWSLPIRWLRVLFIETIMRPLIWIMLAPRVNRSVAPTRQAGPYLIIANHVTALDGALVLYALPRQIRDRVAIAMSGEMLRDFRQGRSYGIPGRFFGPIVYWLLSAMFNVFPLPRMQGFRESFAHAGEALDRGDSVLVFPEGTRSQTGQLGPFRQGIGLLAVQARVAVVPVVLQGLAQIREKDAKWFRSGVLGIRVGEVIPWTPDRSPAEWTAELESAVRKLSA